MGFCIPVVTSDTAGMEGVFKDPQGGGDFAVAVCLAG